MILCLCFILAPGSARSSDEDEDRERAEQRKEEEGGRRESREGGKRVEGANAESYARRMGGHNPSELPVDDREGRGHQVFREKMVRSFSHFLAFSVEKNENK